MPTAAWWAVKRPSTRPMPADDYDIAGFAVGVVDRKKIINGERDPERETSIIGLPSSGIHSNGYSLVRKLFFDMKKYTVATKPDGLGETLGDALLTPTRIYVRSVMQCLAAGIDVKGIVHITGGGFYENIPRILPAGTAARIDRASIDPQPIFRIIQKEGNISDREMFTTFNMGIGMMVITGRETAGRAIEQLKQSGESAREIGVIEKDAGDRVMIGFSPPTRVLRMRLMPTQAQDVPNALAPEGGF